MIHKVLSVQPHGSLLTNTEFEDICLNNNTIRWSEECNIPCSVNCIGEWVKDGECDRTIGRQKWKFDIKSEAAHGGTECVVHAGNEMSRINDNRDDIGRKNYNFKADSNDYKVATENCERDCSYIWSDWTPCSKGKQSRTYSIITEPNLLVEQNVNIMINTQNGGIVNINLINQKKPKTVTFAPCDICGDLFDDPNSSCNTQCKPASFEFAQEIDITRYPQHTKGSYCLPFTPIEQYPDAECAKCGTMYFKPKAEQEEIPENISSDEKSENKSDWRERVKNLSTSTKDTIKGLFKIK